MKDDNEFLDIFQDPLMTIISLVLLSTLWMVLPGTGESKAMADQEEDTSKIEIDKLADEMTRVELNIVRLDGDLQKYSSELEILESQLNEVKKRELSEREYLVLAEGVNQLKKRVERKRFEKKRQEVEMLVLQDRQKENERIVDIKHEIERESEKLKIREKDMTSLTQKFEQSEKLHLGRSELENELQTLTAKKLKAEQAITENEKILGRLETRGNGNSDYTIVAGKKPFQFGLANRKIFATNNINDIRKNYTIDKEHKWRKGIKVSYARLSLKKFVVGESLEEIESPDSLFQKELKNRNPEKEFVVFSLLSDSFKTFRKARSIASSYGFSTDWAPSEKTETVCIEPRKMCPKRAKFRATGP